MSGRSDCSPKVKTVIGSQAAEQEGTAETMGGLFHPDRDDGSAVADSLKNCEFDLGINSGCGVGPFFVAAAPEAAPDAVLRFIGLKR